MKTIDFNQPGGFPFTQNTLGYLQESYMDGINVLAGVAHNETAYVPAIIKGMVQTDAGGGVTNVSAGWFYWNNELVRFPAQSYPTPVGGNAIYVVVTPVGTPLTFNDGSTPDVLFDKTGVLTELASSTPASSTTLLLSRLVPFHEALGVRARTAESSLSVATLTADGEVTGTIYYRKDTMSKNVLIRAVLTASAAQNFAPAPNYAFKLMATLPVGFRPIVGSVYLTAHYIGTPLIGDDAGVSWLETFPLQIETSGDISVRWKKPASGVTTYGIYVQGIVPIWQFL